MSQARILIAPLDWGLGHASRCIPVIRKLIEKGVEPVLAGDGSSLELLKTEFPDLSTVDLPNYPITYPADGNINIHFLRQGSAMLKFYRKEKRLLDAVIIQHNIDAVISDNRYGLYSERIPSVLITHQLRLQVPFFYSPINFVISRFIRKFDSCWVPDYEGASSLAGKLSRNPLLLLNNLMYLGPLSRFSGNVMSANPEYEFLSILSGPEPHRTIFQEELISQLQQLPGRHVVVTGTREKIALISSGIEVRGMSTTHEIAGLMADCRYIISRAGYSTIMDLMVLERHALLVPTPGQAEQEYLGEFHRDKGKFLIQSQDDLNLAKACSTLDQMDNWKSNSNENLLEKAIMDLLNSIK